MKIMRWEWAWVNEGHRIVIISTNWKSVVGWFGAELINVLIWVRFRIRNSLNKCLDFNECEQFFKHKHLNEWVLLDGLKQVDVERSMRMQKDDFDVGT